VTWRPTTWPAKTATNVGPAAREDEDLEGMHAVVPGDEDAADLADEEGSDNY